MFPPLQPLNHFPLVHVSPCPGGSIFWWPRRSFPNHSPITSCITSPVPRIPPLLIPLLVPPHCLSIPIQHRKFRIVVIVTKMCNVFHSQLCRALHPRIVATLLPQLWRTTVISSLRQHSRLLAFPTSCAFPLLYYKMRSGADRQLPGGLNKIRMLERQSRVDLEKCAMDRHHLTEYIEIVSAMEKDQRQCILAEAGPFCDSLGRSAHQAFLAICGHENSFPACAQWCIFSIVRANSQKYDLCSAPIARALPRYIVPFFKFFKTGKCFKTMLFPVSCVSQKPLAFQKHSLLLIQPKTHAKTLSERSEKCATVQVLTGTDSVARATYLHRAL